MCPATRRGTVVFAPRLGKSRLGESRRRGSAAAIARRSGDTAVGVDVPGEWRNQGVRSVIAATVV